MTTIDKNNLPFAYPKAIMFRPMKITEVPVGTIFYIFNEDNIDKATTPSVFPGSLMVCRLISKTNRIIKYSTWNHILCYWTNPPKKAKSRKTIVYIESMQEYVPSLIKH